MQMTSYISGKVIYRSNSKVAFKEARLILGTIFVRKKTNARESEYIALNELWTKEMYDVKLEEFQFVPYPEIIYGLVDGEVGFYDKRKNTFTLKRVLNIPRISMSGHWTKVETITFPRTKYNEDLWNPYRREEDKPLYEGINMDQLSALALIFSLVLIGIIYCMYKSIGASENVADILGLAIAIGCFFLYMYTHIMIYPFYNIYWLRKNKAWVEYEDKLAKQDYDKYYS